MKIVEIVQASPGHAAPIAENMREADKREIWASDRLLPLYALKQSVLMSRESWTCLVHGVPAFMWGVARKGCILSDVGIPWLLGTDAILEVRREFLRQSRAYVARMHRGFARLENIVHADNEMSIRWLKWCGFTIEKEPIERNGELFFPFWREA